MSAQEDKDSEALHSAVIADDVGTVRRLLAMGANPDTFYGDEFNAHAKSILHIACERGRTECVRALLESGAKPDIRDKWGQMPLNYSLCARFTETSAALLDHAGKGAAAIVNTKLGFKNRTCLYSVIERGFLDGIKLLVRYGADVNDQDYVGTTALMECVCVNDDSVIESMKELIDAGADVERKTHRGITALQIAAVRGNIRAVQYLLAAGADVNSRDSDGRNALANMLKSRSLGEVRRATISDGDISVVKILIEAGSNLNSDEMERYGLMSCLGDDDNSRSLLSFLLERGADPSLLVSKERTPMLHALERKNVKNALMMLKFCPNLNTKGSCFLLYLGPCSVHPLRVINLGPCSVHPLDVALQNDCVDAIKPLLLAGDPSWRDAFQSQVFTKLKSLFERQLIDEELHQWCCDRLSAPPPLQELIVCNLRCMLGLRLRHVVPLLPVPSYIKNIILMTFLDDFIVLQSNDTVE